MAHIQTLQSSGIDVKILLSHCSIEWLYIELGFEACSIFFKQIFKSDTQCVSRIFYRFNVTHNPVNFAVVTASDLQSQINDFAGNGNKDGAFAAYPFGHGQVLGTKQDTEIKKINPYFATV